MNNMNRKGNEYEQHEQKKVTMNNMNRKGNK